MSLTWTKGARDSWPHPSSGDTIVLLPGTHRPWEIGAVTDLTIRADLPGIIIKGSLSPRGGEDPCTLRFHDGMDRLKILGPLDLADSRGRGLRLTGSKDCVVEKVFSHDHSTLEAFIFGHCPGLQHLDCTGYNCQGDDHSHAVYYSGDMSGAVSRRFQGYDCLGSFQVNGAALGTKIRGFVAEDAVLKRMGGGGTPAVSLMGVSLSDFLRFLIVDPAAGILREFADGRGSEWACHDNLYEGWDVRGDPGFGCDRQEGSSGWRFVGWTGWEPPGMEPAPEPEPVPIPTPPVPPPDPLTAVRAALAELDEPLSALWHHTERVRGKDLRAVLRADQAALVSGVANAKAAAKG